MKHEFHKIYQGLKLPRQEIAELTEDDEFSKQKSERDKGSDVDALVKEVRQKVHASIQKRCGMMQVLNTSQQIELNDIYTKVNILEKISGCKWLSEFEYPALSRLVRDRLLGLEAVKRYNMLTVLGKPGSGKTTLLKHVAIQCSSGDLQADRVPLFITLKDFAESQRPSLLEYITEQLSIEGIADTSVTEQLLSQGKMLILLNGVDEVKEIDSHQVLQEVHNFTAQFHANQFVMSCQLGTQGYNFEKFIEVEVADLDDEQIASFATKWFTAKDPIISNSFVQKLKANSSIRELVTNPLLLMLLCLVFEESADCPSNCLELYKEGLNILLRKWDTKRNIAGEQIYKKLSVQHKEDLLSQIARITFERGDYFFRQKEIEHYIADYICNLPGVSTEVSALQLESEAVLKSIEAQHGLLVERGRGIYSFSHLKFHEYFTAREIVVSSDPQALETSLKQLVSHITENRWREVFLLTVGMLRNADYLLQLMKQKIDDLLAQDSQLQAFLAWVSRKFHTVSAPYKPVSVRAFYFDLAFARVLAFVGGTLDLTRSIDCNFTPDLDCNLALDLALDHALTLTQVVDRIFDPKRAFECVLERAIAHAHDLKPMLECEVTPSGLGEALQQLKKQLSLSGDRKRFKQWWEANGQTWTEQLRSVMIKYRQIGHNWQFSAQQRKALKQYYDANQLLVDCLNSNFYVTRNVRSKIEETLLLPITEISRLNDPKYG